MNFEQAYDHYTDDYPENEVPKTSSARDSLRELILNSIQSEDDVLIQAPTSLGKTYTVATLPAKEDVGQIVHLSKITDTRDEAFEESENAGLTVGKRRGINDLCSVADGKYDDTVSTPEGMDASEWLAYLRDTKGASSWKAHEKLADYHKKKTGRVLPCIRNDECLSESDQTDDDDAEKDIIHATLSFAYSPDLIEDKCVVFDERPSFERILDEADVTRYHAAITDFLREQTDSDYNIHQLFAAIKTDDIDVKSDLRFAFQNEVDEDRVLLPGSSHVNAPEIGMAMLSADELANGKYRGEYGGVTVVFDEEELLGLCIKPDLSGAKSVICLDAHPKKSLWEMNLGVGLDEERLFNKEEAVKWRTQERGLCVVRVSDNKRPLTAGWWNEQNINDEEKSNRLIEKLSYEWGTDFGTAITAKAVVEDVNDMMEGAGIDDPTVINYGAQKGKNDFGGERIGLLIGCIEKEDGDAETEATLCGSEASISRTEDSPDSRDIEGEPEDVKILREVIHSTREENVAQSAGRYARSPDDPDSRAIVFVWTEKIPSSMVDYVAGGVSRRRRTCSKIPEAVKTAQESDEYEDVSTKDIMDITGIGQPEITQGAQEIDCIEVKGYPNIGYRYEHTGKGTSDIPRSVDLGL
jgi:hypothetical protein